MAKIPQQDPKTSEILSSFIAGLSEAISKLSESSCMQTVSGNGVQLSEVYISESDRYRIYQAPDGMRNWTDDTVKIFKNGAEITQATAHYILDRVGGSIVFEPDFALTPADKITATFTYVNSVVYTSKEETKNKVSEISDSSNNVQYPSAKAVYDLFKTIVDANKVNPYPINSLYISVSPTDPSTLFGGTWERIQDTFLLAAGDTYAAGTTGGEATHKLTINEMPQHSHNILIGNSPYNGTTVAVTRTEKFSNTWMQNEGGNQPHNNMPPYLAVYVWKRTA